MNSTWNDDDLDKILRRAMHAQPESPPIKNLAILAVQKAGHQERLPVGVGSIRYLGWHQFVSAAVALLVMGLAFFIYTHGEFQGEYGLSDSRIESSETATDSDLGIFQLLNSDDAIFAVSGLLLLVLVFIVTQKALTSERYSLATWSNWDLSWH